jgi:DNA replication protein DnaC
MPLNLPHLSDAQSEEIRQRAQISGIDPDVCPTCFSEEDHLGRRNNGTHRFNGLIKECDCEEQIALRKRYLLACVPDQYQRLSLDEWEGDPQPKEDIESYISNWTNFKVQGMGLTILGPGLGQGKTMLATAVAKALIKKGEKVIFLPFSQIITAFRYNDRTIIDKLYNITVLVLDEIIKPPHDDLASIFAERFEDIIRNRTNFQGVNILTSNLDIEQIRTYYERTYSLLEAKQIVITMPFNKDARTSFIAEKNLSRALAGEVAPIT